MPIAAGLPSLIPFGGSHYRQAASYSPAVSGRRTSAIRSISVENIPPYNPLATQYTQHTRTDRHTDRQTDRGGARCALHTCCSARYAGHDRGDITAPSAALCVGRRLQSAACGMPDRPLRRQLSINQSGSAGLRVVGGGGGDY